MGGLADCRSTSANPSERSQSILRVVVVHNHYQQPGGEDQVFAAEVELLRENGHEVQTYQVDNSDIERLNPAGLAVALHWNPRTVRALGAVLEDFRPDIAHFHNTFPLVSPAGYWAAKRLGIPVVQTLHNFRLVCPNGLLYRDGGTCHDCVGKAVPWPGVVHACYRGSRFATLGVASMLASHRALGTYERMVDAYIALSNYSKAQFVQGGLPAEKVVVKPNFLSSLSEVDDLAIPEVESGFGLYVGRLSEEKGIRVLLEAWERLGAEHRLCIVGDGPLREEVRNFAAGRESVSWLNHLSRPAVLGLMRRADYLVLPSIVYENFPVTLIEAFSQGLPVLVSGHGAMAEIVGEGRTGLHFRPEDPDDLARSVVEVQSSAEKRSDMGLAGREEFNALYTGEANYRQLLAIYTGLLGQAA